MRNLPLILDIFLARVDGHIAELNDFLQLLLQVLNVCLLLGNELSAKQKQIDNVSRILCLITVNNKPSDKTNEEGDTLSSAINFSHCVCVCVCLINEEISGRQSK